MAFTIEVEPWFAFVEDVEGGLGCGFTPWAGFASFEPAKCVVGVWDVARLALGSEETFLERERKGARLGTLRGRDRQRGCLGGSHLQVQGRPTSCTLVLPPAT